MATSAADVPGRFDLVISGGSLAGPVGFCLLDALEPSLPFRTHRAIYSYTPTFIERSNVSGNFGDNQQDFFLTSTQRDWSEGEQQRYYRASDQDSVRRYWQGSGVDITIPGKVSMRKDVVSATAAANVLAATTGLTGDPNIYFVTATNLYSITPAGSITDLGAHGLGASPSLFGLCSDGSYLYISTTSAGTAGVRRCAVTGPTYATFSVTGSDSLAFLNNTLYGYGTGNLRRYDTAGVATTIDTRRNAIGDVVGVKTRLRAFGGKLLILHQHDGSDRGSELWIYDGTGSFKLAEFPPNFLASDCEILFGNAFISGIYQRSATDFKPAVISYINGTIAELWRADDWGASSAPGISTFDGGLVFSDDIGLQFKYFNPSTGGVHSIGVAPSASSGQFPQLVGSTQSFTFFRPGQTTIRIFPASTTVSSSTVTTSLFDFDSSLTKAIRGITVDYDAATDGNGGSIDISYQLNSVDGAFTSLQTGATSGTEYTLSSGTTARSVSVKVTLNKGTSTNGPVLKRIYVRAAPILTSFRMGEYVLDCTGDGGKSPRTLRDGTPNPLSGSEQLTQLETAKASTTPLTITDRRGGYQGFIETLEAYEEHPGIDDPTRSGEFVVKLITRGV